jgi:hypothetical protein
MSSAQDPFPEPPFPEPPFAPYEDGLPPRQPRRHYRCHRAPERAPIDGDLGKDFWAAVPWTEDFVDIEGDLRPPPRQRTRAKLLWDDQRLYVAAELEETDLWATLTERDTVIFQDNDFELFLNPSNDGLAYYELELNALNTVWDLVLRTPYRMGGRDDSRWSIRGLETAVRLDGTLNRPGDRDRRWTVEIAIPFESLDVHPAVRRVPRAGDRWLLNFSRVQWDLEVVDGAYRKVAGRPEHNWVWSPQGMIDMHLPLRWGWLEFVE